MLQDLSGIDVTAIWDNPDIFISSANVVGFVSSNIPSKKDVPNSGC